MPLSGQVQSIDYCIHHQFGTLGVRMGQPPGGSLGAHDQSRGRIGVAAAGRHAPVPRLLLQFTATIAGRNLRSIRTFVAIAMIKLSCLPRMPFYPCQWIEQPVWAMGGRLSQLGSSPRQ